MSGGTICGDELMDILCHNIDYWPYSTVAEYLMLPLFFPLHNKLLIHLGIINLVQSRGIINLRRWEIIQYYILGWKISLLHFVKLPMVCYNVPSSTPITCGIIWH